MSVVLCVLQVLVEGEVEEIRRPDVYADSLLLDDLRPSTMYHFLAVVGSRAGVADPLFSNATTPIGECENICL